MLRVRRRATITTEQNFITIAFTGEGGGKLAELCDITLAIPSNVTARIQEMHILAGHIMCEIIEEDY